MPMRSFVICILLALGLSFIIPDRSKDSISIIVILVHFARVIGMIQTKSHQEWAFTKNVTKSIDSMTGREFEFYCARLLKKQGYYHVNITPESGDFGADIVAVDKAGHTWVFQCKRYKTGLGNKPIQEVVAAKNHYHAQYAGVMTNSTFTDAARQLAKENSVVLFERIH